MFEELLEKSYFFRDGSTCPTVQLNESEREEILKALSTFYEMSQMSPVDVSKLELIMIVLFNYGEQSCIKPERFSAEPAVSLYNEICKEFGGTFEGC